MTEIDERFKLIERRLQKIEEKVFVDKKQPQNSDFEGLSGGIRLLIKDGFLNQLRSLNEIELELKRENYHYSIASLAKILATNFTKKQKILNRIKDGKVWKYVIRK